MISNRICNRIVTLSSVALLCGATAVFAQTGQNDSSNQSMSNSSMSSSSNMSSNKASMADKKFVKTAMQGNMAEVQLGQLAADKGGAEDVKDFGQKMVTDHTKLNDQLKPIAQQIGVMAPTEVPAKDQALMTKLQSESGDQFDKTYIKAMVKDHHKDLRMSKKEAANGKDPAVKNAASQASQVISQHLQMAEQLAKAHNVMAGGGMHMHHHQSSTNSGSTGMQQPQ